MKKYSVFFLLLLPIILFSQENEKKEEKIRVADQTVTVTANRIETDIAETGSSVTVITREDLERMKALSVVEVLESLAGISIVRNGPLGAASQVLIRGANSEHIKILIDGVEVNDPITPSRSFDFSLLLAGDLDRIEILRGPQSTLYGSDAMGGVIHLLTRKGGNSPLLSFAAGGGSHGLASVRAGISGSGEIWDFALDTDFMHNRGISAAASFYPGNTEKDGQRNLNISARLGLQPSRSLSFNLTIRTFSSRNDIDNFGGPYGDDPNNIQRYRGLILKGEARYRLLGNHWEQILSLAAVSYNRSYDNPVDISHPLETDESSYSSRSFQMEWQHNLYLHKTTTLSFGAAARRESGSSSYSSVDAWGPYSSFFPDRQAQMTGLFAQGLFRLGGWFAASVGMRCDHHSRFGSAVTFRAAPAIMIPDAGIKIRGAVGTAFKAPSLYQLYAPSSSWGPMGNLELDPERSLGWELGWDQTLFKGTLQIGGTYFANKFTDLIEFDYICGFINLGKSVSRGWEWNISALISRKLRAYLDYARIRSRELETGAPLLRRPDYKASLRLSYRFLEAANLALQLIGVGRREDNFYVGMTAASRVTMPPFVLLNAVLDADIFKNINAYLKLGNILNTRYELVKGYGNFGFSLEAGVRFKH